MSRFDDFAKSRAEGRGFFSALKRTSPSAELDSAGVSRRDLMKKAGLVTGAAVVGSTLIQSVTAPAYATSHCSDPVDAARGCGSTCPALCPNTSPCETANDCASGVCTNNLCAGAGLSNGSSCTGTTQLQKDSSCASGYCAGNNKCDVQPSVQPGKSCHASSFSQATTQCGTGAVCSGASVANPAGVCKRLSGQACDTGADCLSGTCPSATKLCL